MASEEGMREGPSEARQATRTPNGGKEAQKANAQPTEARSQSAEKWGMGAALVDTRTPKQRREDQFEAWWLLVPRKRGKGQARCAFPAALASLGKSGGGTDPVLLLRRATIAWAESVKDEDPKFVKHPATWLRAEGWHDEPDSKPGIPTEGFDAARVRSRREADERKRAELDALEERFAEEDLLPDLIHRRLIELRKYFNNKEVS